MNTAPTQPPKKSLFEKVWDIVTTLLVLLLVLGAVLLMGARVVGLSVYNIISPSMTPTYNVGDLIYVKKVSPDTIKVGDPITFVLNEDLIVATHRVVRIDTEKQRFYTKGDANEIEDMSPVHYKNLIGKPIFKIPLLGYVSDWVQNPPGTYIALGIGALLLILVFLPDFFGKKKKEVPAQTVPAQEVPQTVPAQEVPQPAPEAAPVQPAPDQPPQNP